MGLERARANKGGVWGGVGNCGGAETGEDNKVWGEKKVETKMQGRRDRVKAKTVVGEDFTKATQITTCTGERLVTRD